MRVAYVSADPGVPVFGCKGCSVHVQEVLREFVRRGAKVDLITTRIGGDTPPELNGVTVSKIDLAPGADLQDKALALVNANETIRQVLTSRGPYDFVYERYALYSHAAMVYAKNWKTPGILEVNSPLIQEQAEYRELAHREIAEQSTRRVMTMAAAVVAVSQQVETYVKEQRLCSSNIHVLPNGVDPARFPPRATYDASAKPFTIGFVGTLKPWHGVSDLIDAFRLLRSSTTDAQLVIVGDGPERKNLQDQTKSLPANIARSIHFTGAVSPAEIPSLLVNWDVAVAPYQQQEGFYFSPLKIFEYMAAGLPTVAGKIGQISELIEHGKSGLLVAPGNPELIANALTDLATHPELRTRMGQAARARVLSQSTWKSVVDRILAIANRHNRKLSSKPLCVRGPKKHSTRVPN